MKPIKVYSIKMDFTEINAVKPLEKNRVREVAIDFLKSRKIFEGEIPSDVVEAIVDCYRAEPSDIVKCIYHKRFRNQTLIHINIVN